MKGVRAKKTFRATFSKRSKYSPKNCRKPKWHKNYQHLLEIGPGTGVLKVIFLIDRAEYELLFMDVDQESVDYLQNLYPDYKDKIIKEDFLRIDLGHYYKEPFGIIGEFPLQYFPTNIFQGIGIQRSDP